MRKRHQWMNMLQQMAMMLFGTFVLAFTYYHINFQNHLSEGGFVGLALLAKYTFNLPPALTMVLLDIPVLIIAMYVKGRKFIINTIVASISFSLFYEIFERFSPLTLDFHHVLLPAAILSGVFTGFGAGIVLRFGGATGGDDILSLLVSRATGMKLGTVFILMDAIVLVLSLFYLPLKETLYTILSVLIAGKMITMTARYGVQDTVLVPKTVHH
ncbi:YitT family protein [Paenibacillus sediminis]|uniref:Uncharacterized membrane-anchored protein YitT (DUF2179 family) n=1 Tax=Paenibacillus sediminis TaxID=664909 RepID=A0ABS4H0G3_9BACL|nr:YitT family protein [Paenibacillus sediminis]MBP1935605.1 uncharacterized membrane-anchored protein YitT (DUF2179 family) [Paenibacillus sediminis]